DGRVMGCYLHGLFSADDFRREFLAQLGGRGDGALHYDARIEEILDRWADHLERHLALDAIAALAGIGTPSL
ncbi:MAG TPA: cobyric acid synthase CobQ, partial [Alphaproteobacteria bacterium]|nr:cobyric acid synthase CobQ [Alphaproteobacteria bacterium]